MKQIRIHIIAITFICFLYANISLAQDSNLIAQIQPWDSISETALSSRFGSHLFNGVVELGYSEKFKAYVYVVTERPSIHTKVHSTVCGPRVRILNQMTVNAFNGEVLRKKQIRSPGYPFIGTPSW